MSITHRDSLSYMDDTTTLTKILMSFSKLESEESEVDSGITEGDNVEQ